MDASTNASGVAPGTLTVPRAVGPGAARGPFVPGAAEERKVVDFWNQVGGDEHTAAYTGPMPGICWIARYP